tara:strand:- start:733 stop:894 length:162 start_codon:yes stop_codon:yes gene_type:complete
MADRSHLLNGNRPLLAVRHLRDHATVQLQPVHVHGNFLESLIHIFIHPRDHAM